jgi:hypothetical protein
MTARSTRQGPNIMGSHCYGTPVVGSDAQGRAKFVASLFQIAARMKSFRKTFAPRTNLGNITLFLIMRKQLLPAIFSLVLISLAGGNTSGAARVASPAGLRRVRPATTCDPRLEAAIISALYDGDESSAKRDKVRYYYNHVDLNADGQPEVLVYLFGATWCGSAGCTALVFQHDHGKYALVTQISGVELPVIVSRARTNGWQDLIAHVRWGEVGGRTLRDYYAVLRFDGRTYPDQFPGGPPVKLRKRMAGTAYLSGDESSASGLLLGEGNNPGREVRQGRRAYRVARSNVR